tara:strand:+ start:259 stop:417 length:159 start_codon:yes stop_codon:yes gene_type:complete
MPPRRVYPVAADAVFVCSESHVFSWRAGVAHNMAIIVHVVVGGFVEMAKYGD